MKRSKGTYLQGVIEAERLVESLIDNNNLDIRKTLTQKILHGQGPTCYYDGSEFCEGWYDFMDYFLDNEDYLVYTKTKK